ncbi:MinD/ParA family protein|uniref:Flagellar biosynthesis protein FlhG n=1 Tax=Dendrosporobacter quercicolus TaxID=146817 RepID=A0A1G9MHU6_9FIRM|nr:MinD/ParA family protein [Dendrosporobacter quercicolus]NSL47042.1 MinD/ParA family protein [Dendrosporobacter quercicolus DSM 1736]SDL73769.1 flagellar biosynthesis protein FlhG [Dendrosporobacter quercicolus]
MHDQAEKLRQLVQTSQGAVGKSSDNGKNNTRVITITSGKGGVGKTNFTVNLAVALARLGQKILVIDADLGAANVDVVLGCTSSYSLLHIIDDQLPIADVIADGPEGIRYLSGGSGIQRLANLDEIQLARLINKIALFDSWADIILIDTGAGVSRNVINFVLAADEVILITTPEPTALTDAYAMLKTYSSYQGTASLKLVVNRVTEIAEGEMVKARLMNAAARFLALSVDSLGVIYEDSNLVRAVKKQQPVLLAYPGTIASRCIKTIAGQLINHRTPAAPQGIKGFFHKVLGFWNR